MYPPRLVEQMRDDRSECGFKGDLFEEVKRYAEFDDL
jgi:hypothetical protein